MAESKRKAAGSKEDSAEKDTATAAGTSATGAGATGQGDGPASSPESVQGTESPDAELVRLRAELAEREAELAEIKRVVADAVDEVESETYRLTGKQSVAGEGYRYVRGTASGTITRAQYVALPAFARAYFEAVE